MNWNQTLRLRRRSDDGWRALRLLNAYRWVIAVGLTVVFVNSVGDHLFATYQPRLFGAACALYLLLCILATIAAYRRLFNLRAQAFALAVIDICIVITLLIAGGGIASGLGLLLLAPIVGTGTLVSRRIAALLAAVTSIALLLEEGWQYLQFTGDSADWFQAGLLGAVLFLATLLAHGLSSRARSSAALAARRKSELEDLTQLNSLIVEQMQIGVVVLGNERHIHTLNAATKRLLNLHDNDIGLPLAHVVPQLDTALDEWHIAPHLSTEPLSIGAHLIEPRFARLGHKISAPILIFLEDASRLSEQAQQMKLASLGRLTASIAHEIRNPLSAISQAGQLLDESANMDSNDQRLLNIIDRQSRRLDAIVKNVLSLSRSSRSQPQRIPLAEWLEQAIEDYVQGMKDVPHIQLDNIPADFAVHMDPSHLLQILYNLWDNARLHAQPENGQLLITIRADQNNPGGPQLDVCDNGPGVDPKVRDQILEPFFTTSHAGAGLGLYICNELCALNRVHLYLLEHRAGSGACFRLTFPAVNESVEAPGSAAE